MRKSSTMVLLAGVAEHVVACQKPEEPNRRHGGDARGARGRCRRRQGADQGRHPALAVGHDGHQRDVAQGRRPDDDRGDQREGRRPRPQARAGGRRPRLELAAVRREGPRADLRRRRSPSPSAAGPRSRASRCSPVFEELNGLLFYPVQYEGEESSWNVFYTGAAPNQQAIPAVEYLMSKKGGGAKRWVLLGTDYVYPRTTNKILRYFLHSKGVADEDIMEKYTPFGHSDYQTIVADMKKFAAGKRTAVVSTINGDSNVPFYKELGNQGLKADGHPGRRVLGRRGRAARHRHQAARRPPGRLELLHVDRHAREQGVHRQVEGLREEEQPAGRRQARHQRPDGSHVRRHPDVGAGRRAGRTRPTSTPSARRSAARRSRRRRASRSRWTPRTTTCTSRSSSARSRPTVSSRSCGRPTARSARRPGARSSPTAPRRSPTGLTRGSAATATSAEVRRRRDRRHEVATGSRTS